jgi:uncharacterized protein (TIGR03083 family)
LHAEEGSTTMRDNATDPAGEAARHRSPLSPVAPVFLADLFPPLHAELMALLRGLLPEDWARPTSCALWSVRDIVAHLLDTGLRRLSFGRDRHIAAPGRAISGYPDLVAYLNELNAEWVAAMRRLGPRLLTDLSDWLGPELHRYLDSLDPHGAATFSVAWAGQEESPNWFDIGREYTERWLHQQQIREAVGAAGLTSRRWLYPALDIFVRALPFTYRSTTAKPGTTLRLDIEGEAGGSWTLARTGESWQLLAGAEPTWSTRVTLDQDAAWRLFSKSLPPDRARQEIQIEGDAGLGRTFLSTLAVMA